MSGLLRKHTQSKWLKSEDLRNMDGFENCTIRNLREVEFNDGVSLALGFREYDKELILNVGNTHVLLELFGADEEACIGQVVGIFTEWTKTPSGQRTRGVRLRGAVPPTVATPQPQAPAQGRSVKTPAQLAQEDEDRRLGPNLPPTRGQMAPEPAGFVDAQDPGPSADDEIPF